MIVATAVYYSEDQNYFDQQSDLLHWVSHVIVQITALGPSVDYMKFLANWYGL